MPVVTSSLSAQNTFTDWVSPKVLTGKRNYGFGGFLNFSITGTWVGTITIQCRYDQGDPIDLNDGAFTSNVVKIIEDHERTVEYRAGFKTGGYTSGTAVVRLGIQ